MNEDDEWRMYIELARKELTEDEMYEIFGADAEPEPIQHKEPEKEDDLEEIPF